MQKVTASSFFCQNEKIKCNMWSWSWLKKMCSSCFYLQLCERLSPKLSIHRKLANPVPPVGWKSPILLPTTRPGGHSLLLKRSRSKCQLPPFFLPPKSPPDLCFPLTIRRVAGTTASRMPRLTVSKTNSSSCRPRPRGTASITLLCLSELITDPGRSSTRLSCCWITREFSTTRAQTHTRAPFHLSPLLLGAFQHATLGGIMHAKSSRQHGTQDKAAEVALYSRSWCEVTASARSDSVFWATKKMETLQSVAPDSNHSNLLSLEPEWYIYFFSTRGEEEEEEVEKKIDEVYFIGKHQADFIDNPNVSLSQPPHARSQDLHRNTHIATNAASLGAARSLPPILSPLNTNTKTPTQ